MVYAIISSLSDCDNVLKVFTMSELRLVYGRLLIFFIKKSLNYWWIKGKNIPYGTCLLFYQYSMHFACVNLFKPFQYDN